MNPWQTIDEDIHFGMLGICSDRILAPRMPPGTSGSVEWVAPMQLLIRAHDRKIIEKFLDVAELENVDAIARGMGLVEIGALLEPTGEVFRLFPLPGIAPDAECNDGSY